MELARFEIRAGPMDPRDERLDREAERGSSDRLGEEGVGDSGAERGFGERWRFR